MAQSQHRLLRAIRHEVIDRTPVWLMRQAGRYLPEYRASRAKAGSFMALCKNPELACEVTLQPLARFPLDAAIIFSDILTIPDAMGLGLHFVEGEGPHFQHAIQSAAAISKLTVPDPEQLRYVYDAIALTKQALGDKTPVIGFCGAPWTLAAYMIEGKSVPGFPGILTMMREDPALLKQLLSVLADSVVMHLGGQIEAGADVVMVFDTWGGLLSQAEYRVYGLPFVTHIIQSLKAAYETPIILFTKGGSAFFQELAHSGCDVLGLDWTQSLGEARASSQNKLALQGNLNPATLLTSPPVIREEVGKVLKDYGVGSGHIFNLGHGVTPNVPPEHVQTLIEAVIELSPPYHATVGEEKSNRCA
ncbi:MAG: uroporphyrinogen decarboxylase [Gammaproteobacteria bacterium]|nr:uroporphyrinogen decarboxylase [Gammaproteobacteria bacterium]